VIWEEKPDRERYQIPDLMVDLSFRVKGEELPVDHLYALSAQIIERLPWLTDAPGSGVHPIHLAEVAAGWQRPEYHTNSRFYLSRRTRLRLRLPRVRIDAAEQLNGKTLEVDGCELTIGASTVKVIEPSTTLIAHHMAGKEDENENTFVDRLVEEMGEMGIKATKLLCGKTHRVQLMESPVNTRSLLLADLSPIDSITLLYKGLGPMRHFGFGLFIPHKGISAVRERQGQG